MTYYHIFICILLMIVPSLISQEQDMGTKVMECEYCNSVDITMYLKDGKYHINFNLSPDVIKMGTVSWPKILKKIRESEKYKNVKQNIRFLPYNMPENTSYRPNVHTEIVKAWRENTTICLVLFKCIFVMSNDVAQNMLWQLKGTSNLGNISIDIVLNSPKDAQNFYCFFPLVKSNKDQSQEDTQETDPKEYLFMKIGKKEGNNLVAEAFGEQEILEQTEITVDGWVPTVGRMDFNQKEPIIINLPKRSALFDSNDVEIKPGVSTVK